MSAPNPDPPAPDPLDPNLANPNDAISDVLISQTMAAPAGTTTNPVGNPDPDVIGTSSATSSAATTIASSVQPTTSSTPSTTSSAITSSSVSSAVVPSSSSSSSLSSSAVSSVASSAAATSSSTTVSSAAPTTSVAPSTQVVTVTRSQVSAPGLVTNVSVSRSTSTPSRSAAAANGKGGVGGSGLSVGALVGIVIGGVAVLAAIGLLVTRSMRKRARAKRTANRSSMFEPWPAPVAMEDEPYEKPAYGGGPAQSYPLQDATNEVYGDAAYPAYGNQAGYQQYNEYPPQQYAAYPTQPYSDNVAAAGVAAAGAAGVGAATGVAAANGLHDGMMVRVKVAFVRSLEDELAITPGQQLYLHTAYDDGWTLCEDQAQNRGVVPISCLEPWEETAAAAPYPQGQDGQNLDVNADESGQAGRRRSSLYAPQ